MQLYRAKPARDLEFHFCGLKQQAPELLFEKSKAVYSTLVIVYSALSSQAVFF